MMPSVLYEHCQERRVGMLAGDMNVELDTGDLQTSQEF